MVPIHRLEQDLSILVAVEDDRGCVAEVAGRLEQPARDLPGQQPASQRAAVHRPFDGAAADDQRHGIRQSIRHRPRVWIAAAGHERDVNATGDRLVDGVAVGLRHAAVTVEQRAVDVDANEANHPAVIVP